MRRSRINRAVFKEIMASTRAYGPYGHEERVAALSLSNRKRVNPHVTQLTAVWRGQLVTGNFLTPDKNLYVSVKQFPVGEFHAGRFPLMTLSQWADIVYHVVDIDRAQREAPEDGIPWEIHRLADVNLGAYLAALRAAREARP